MRVASIGGGPGGLYLASLLKRERPDADMTVFERNPPDATFGFGVVFSERTLDSLRESDPSTYSAIANASVAWEDIEVRHRGAALRCGGHGFSAIARKRLLAILQERAADAGAELRFDDEVEEIPAEDYDLVVGADGVNSLVREERSEDFRPSVEVGAAKYIWFATSKLFDALTFLFEESEHGHFAVHAYPFDEETSTFIVETDEESWRRAGLDHPEGATLAPGESDLLAMEYCRELFAGHLDGEPLLANNSKWLNFRTIRNARWHSGNVALIGDAAHTAHFSVGSGTKMAMEDAISLAMALADGQSVGAALETYERERRPAVDRIQRASRPSQLWWETFRYPTHRPSEQFAFHFLTRTPGFVTRERLRGRDARFVRRVERWFADEAAGPPGTPGASALSAPLTFGEVTLPNRLAVSPHLPPDHSLACKFAHVAAPALSGAGLVLVSVKDGTGPGVWEPSVRFVHEHSRAAVGLRLAADSESLADAAGEAGFDLLLVEGDPATVDRMRGTWPAGRPLAARLTAPAELPEIEAAIRGLVASARGLVESGCDLIALGAAGGDEDARLVQLLAADRIRAETGVLVMLIGGPATRDEAATAVLAGRADLCQGSPDPASDRWEICGAPASARGCSLSGGVAVEAR